MAAKKTQEKSEYRWPHPRFKTSTDKKWLEGRNKYPTGYCTSYIPLDAQGHEGTKPHNRLGVPLKVCPFPTTCPCTCHQEIDQMYEMAGMPRPEVEQTHEYLEHMRFQSHETVIPNDLESVLGDVPSIAMGTDALPDDERAAAGHQGTVPDTLPSPARTFHATPTGRRAKGQLEYDVLKVCQEWTREVYDWPDCTPKLVAERIGRVNATEPPSTGAINAVWDRWERLGFAEQAKKPSRFVKFTGAGTVTELDFKKKYTKRQAKRAATEARLRPTRRG